MLSSKIKLKVEKYDSQLRVSCQPKRMKSPNDDILGISFDMLRLKDVINSNYIPISHLVQHTIDAILSQLEDALFGNKIYELIDDCFLSFTDPLYNELMKRIEPENKQKIHDIYFSCH